MLKQYKLNNSTNILVKEEPNASSVSCYGYFPYGVAIEEDFQQGITHLVEHLMLTSIDGFPTAQDVALAFEESGIIFEAVTFRDMVTCGIQTPKTELFKGFQLLSEVLLNSKFNKKHFTNEVKVIKEELDFYAQDSEFSIWNKTSEAIWGSNHSLGRKVEGTWENIKKLSYNDVKTYYDELFVPEMLTFIIVGNITCDEIKPMLEDYEKRFPFKEVTPKLNLNFNMEKDNVIENEGKGRTWIGLGFPFPTDEVPDRYLLELIEMLLTEGNSSLLQKNIREEKGLVYHLMSDSNTSRYGGEFTVAFCTETSQANVVINSVLTALDQSFEFSEREFETAKTRLIAQMSFITESTRNHARFIGRNYMVHNNVMDRPKYIEKVKTLEIENVRNFMKLLFDKSKMVSTNI